MPILVGMDAHSADRRGYWELAKNVFGAMIGLGVTTYVLIDWDEILRTRSSYLVVIAICLGPSLFIASVGRLLAASTDRGGRS